MKKSIKTELIIMMLFIGLVPIMILGTISIINIKKMTEIEFKETTESFIKIVEENVGKVVRDCENKLEYLSDFKEFKDALDSKNKDFINGKLKEFKDVNKEVEYYTFATENSLLYTYPQDGMDLNTDLTKRDWYIGAVNNKGKTYVSEVYKDISSNKHVITVAKAIYKEKQLVGVIASDISLEGVSKIFNNLTMGSTGKIIISDSKGEIISGEVNGISNIKKDNKTGYIEFTQGKEKKQGYYGTSEKNNWNIALTQDKKEVNKDLNYLSLVILITMITCTIVVSLIGIIYSSKLVKAIKEILTLINKNSKGDFRETIDLRGNKELEILGDYLNEMQEHIVFFIGNLKSAMERMSNSSEEIKVMSGETNNSVNEITKVIEELSMAAVSSSDKIENLRGEINSVVDGVNKIKNNTEVSSKISSEMKGLSDEGIEIVNSLIESSKTTVEATTKVESGIKEVLESAKRIEGINHYIRGITEQTNLLALNASIEAARAGESGRGFAVVAGEIRGLADETSGAADKISQIIDGMLKEVERTVKDSKATNDAVISQEDKVESVKNMFETIKESTNKSSKAVLEVETEVRQLKDHQDKILEEIENIYEISEEYAAATEEISASCSDLDEKSQHLNDNYKNLSELNIKIQKLISKFKIK